MCSSDLSILYIHMCDGMIGDFFGCRRNNELLLSQISFFDNRDKALHSYINSLGVYEALCFMEL